MTFATKLISALIQTVVAVIAWRFTYRGTLFGRAWPAMSVVFAMWMWVRAYNATKED